jgi:hypothetical protein
MTVRMRMGSAAGRRAGDYTCANPDDPENCVPTQDAYSAQFRGDIDEVGPRSPKQALAFAASVISKAVCRPLAKGLRAHDLISDRPWRFPRWQWARAVQKNV